MSEEAREERDRKYPRVKESCRVKYRIVEDPVLQPEERGGVAVNISGGGMCFASDHEIPAGAMLAMELSLEELPTPVVSLGRVVWCDRADTEGRYDVGVEFWWIGWADSEAQTRMLEYVSRKLDQLGIDGP
jgi:c-di-GMP-binding flagellar brake protein YcgR